MQAVKTKDEFITWLKLSIGGFYNPDRQFGFQCYDYVQSGWAVLFPGTRLSGLYAKNIASDNKVLLNGRATVYRNTPEFLAKPGDMCIFPGSFGNGAGHVAWVLSANLNSLVLVEQNWEGGGWTSGTGENATGWEGVTKRTHSYDPNMIFIRPNFKTSTTSSTSGKTIPKGWDGVNQYGTIYKQEHARFTATEEIQTYVGSPKDIAPKGYKFQKGGYVDYDEVCLQDNKVWIGFDWKSIRYYMPVRSWNGKTGSSYSVGKAKGTFK